MDRRERTRRLIVLGGLVEKAGLAELTGEDDQAVLLGGLLELAESLQGAGGLERSGLLKQRGLLMLEADGVASKDDRSGRPAP